jgi:hypothetical protein
MSTLPPKPTYDPNVPVVSSAGGGSAAYKDPNSPESILRKTSTLDAQSKVDSRYDVVEKFRSRQKRISNKQGNKFFFLVLLILVVYFALKAVKFAAKVFLGIIAIMLLIVIVVIYKNV